MRVGQEHHAPDPETLQLLGVGGGSVGADYVGADYVGADYVGADYVGADYVGAGPRRAMTALRRVKITPQAHLAMARNMPAIFLGFVQLVPASGFATAASEGNVALRPTDLVVSSVVASDFSITTMVIGRTQLLAGATAIPADAFNTSVVRPPISSPVLEAGTVASIGLGNLTLAASTFRAMYTCLDLSKHPSSP
jgi:hypothetical protein